MSTITGPASILTSLLLSTTACFSQVPPTTDKTNYGPDGRLDFYQVSNPVKKAALGSAVSIFRLNAGIVPDGDHYLLTGRTLAERQPYLCPENLSTISPQLCSAQAHLSPRTWYSAPDIAWRKKTSLPDTCSAARLVFGFSLAPAARCRG